MKKKRKEWPFKARLEAVKARQRGLSYREVEQLIGMSATVVNRCAGLPEVWRSGTGARVDGVESRGPARRSAKTLVAEQAVAQLGPQGEAGGIGKVQGLLYRLGLLKVSRGTVAKVLERQGRMPKPMARRRRNRPVKVRHFERAKPNELWQTDIMRFMIRGQYRVYLIGFMDDHSRFIVGWGLYPSSDGGKRAGGVPCGDRETRAAEGSAVGQRAAVLHVAGQEPVHGDAHEAGHPAHPQPAVSPADVRQDRVVLAQRVSGVPVADAVGEFRGGEGQDEGVTSSTTTSSGRIRGSGT